jgi:rhodanese-related sulfurtransferase
MKSKLLLLFAVVCMTSCASVKSARVHFRSLDAATFAKYIEQKDVMLVDVRTAEEYAAGHLPNVERNLDVRSATFFKDYQSLPKDKTIALYCKGGGRSKQVAGVLAGNGYKVVELSVGYDGWVKAGGATVK